MNAADTGAADTARRLLSLGAATLGESGGQPMHPRIKPAWPGARLAGPAYTVVCGPADNLAIHVAVASSPAGCVLVVAAQHPPERGYWGEVLTTGAEARGLTGLIIDGGVRDVAALERHRWPVFSALVALRGAAKAGGGSVGAVAVVGDVAVASGDWVVADVDGVSVVAADRLEAVLLAGQARADNEETFFAQLREGATTMELLGLNPDAVERGGGVGRGHRAGRTG